MGELKPRSRIARMAVLLLIGWWIIALVVFAFRHPWMTSTQRTLHLWSALTFSEVR